jgi:putative SOS response-associated peptidase YedK
MSAFYEWKKEGTKKIPYRIFLPDEEIFFVPALYSYGNNKRISTSLIKTIPNKFMQSIHHRMPVILKIKDGINYLVDDAETNLTRCVPYSGKMDLEPASI